MVSQKFGETTLEEVREGISYGANTIRDGVSIQRVEVQKPVVPASEILKLSNLSCYVRLPGNYPIYSIDHDAGDTIGKLIGIYSA